MNVAVYIPTKNPEFSKPVVEIPIHICTQPGLGNSRAMCIEHAKKHDYTHILMLDDDIKVPDNFMQLFSHFEKDPKLAWVSGHNTGTNCWSGIVRNTGLKYTYSLGIQMVVLDVNKVLEVGNYNRTLNKHEDTELAIKLMKAGYYRAVDTDVIYKHTRHYDPEKNQERMFKWNKILRELKINLNRVDQYRAHRVMLYLCAKNLKVDLDNFLETINLEIPKIEKSLFNFEENNMIEVKNTKNIEPKNELVLEHEYNQVHKTHVRLDVLKYIVRHSLKTKIVRNESDARVRISLNDLKKILEPHRDCYWSVPYYDFIRIENLSHETDNSVIILPNQIIIEF